MSFEVNSSQHFNVSKGNFPRFEENVPDLATCKLIDQLEIKGV